MSKKINNIYQFGEFRLETAERQLLRSGQQIPLTPKMFELLLVLVESTGHAVGKGDLMTRVWEDAFVEEANLARNIWALRKALGDDSDEHRYIETVPKLGYRFIAPVTQLVGDETGLLVQRRIRARVVTEEEDTSDDSVTKKHFVQRSTALARSAPITSTRRLAFLGLLTVAVLAIALGTVVVVRGIRSASPARPIESVAIMPFSNLSNVPELDYLSEGLTENLVNRLSHVSRLKVIAHNSVYRYRGQQIDAQKVGKELGVQAVLISKLAARGDKLEISSELVDARDGTHIWGDHYERSITDLQSLQAELTQDMSTALRLELSGEEKKRLAHNGSQNPEAYRLYLEGRYFWNKRTLEGEKKGLECFERALQLDPQYAQAYVGLADCYIVMSQSGAFSPNEVMPKAKSAALSALKIDDSVSEAHASLAMINELYDWNWKGAETEFKRAIDLNPNYATAHHWYAMYLSALGRHDEALAEIHKAELLDPVSMITNTNEGWILFSARRYDEAIAKLRATIDMDPNFANAHYKLGLVYEIKGMYKEAVEENVKNEALSGMSSADVEKLRAAYATSGWSGFCREKLVRLKTSSSQNYVSPRDLVLASMRMKDSELTFKWLAEAYRERTEPLMYLRVDPRFDFIRSDSRYEELASRIGL